jgi:lysophospholipase L1-like esterase
VRRLSVPLLAGALMLSLAACQDDEPDGGGTFHYVALGDSYTAAPGVPFTDRSNPCLRSDQNYPHLLAEELPFAELTDVSCSGAGTLSVTEPQHEDVDPQLDAVSDETDLVTISLGGNNSYVFANLQTTCRKVAPSDPDGSPCADGFATGTGTGDVLLDQVAKLPASLESVIADVEERAPDATIVLVTYPQILPSTGTCPDRLPFAEGDYAYFNSVIAAMNDAMVTVAESTGVEWIDVEKASLGHDICSDEPWINSFMPDTDVSRGNALHPFPEEQAAIAELLLEKLRELDLV